MLMRLEEVRQKSIMIRRNFPIAFCFLFLTTLSSTFAESATSAAGQLDQARYDYYRIYYVELDTQRHVDLLQQLEEKSDSYSFMGHARHPKQKLTILVAAHKIAEFADLLKTYKINHRILTYNFQEKIDKNLAQVLPKNTPLTQFDWNHYYHLETIYQWMEQKVAEHPNTLKMIDMGRSAQGFPIKGVKLARNHTNKAIFIESGIHAREWIAPATATYLLEQLLTSDEQAIQHLANNFNWLIFPVVNPDGYKYSFESDRMWRKNRELFGICRGVDLNRNYPDHWNTTGTSGDPCRYDYSGPSASSEAETKALIKFVQEHLDTEQIRTYLSLHSYSQMIMFPYSHTPERVYNYDDLTYIGRKAAEKIKSISGRIYKSGSIYETIYPSSGGSKDWAHGELKIPVTFTFELRGPPDSQDMFILPAEEIQPTAEEAFRAIATIVEESEKKGYYK